MIYRRNKQKLVDSWTESRFGNERIHLDHLFFKGRKVLLIYDSYGGVTEAFFYCYKHGEIFLCVADNATSFNSKEFYLALEDRNIYMAHSIAYRPWSNGSAAR
uniref:Integrase catalytic domain-containing protein n=1 Tax=Strongyloides venezuelensis TaxID=75913 RepID=A0A0K0F361_STRVS